MTFFERKVDLSYKEKGTCIVLFNIKWFKLANLIILLVKEMWNKQLWLKIHVNELLCSAAWLNITFLVRLFELDPALLTLFSYSTNCGVAPECLSSPAFLEHVTKVSPEVNCTTAGRVKVQEPTFGQFLNTCVMLQCVLVLSLYIINCQCSISIIIILKKT